MADTIKAVRDTIAKNLSAQATRDAAQDARIKALEDRLATPAQAPTPAAANTPQPVIDAGMADIWALRHTAGPAGGKPLWTKGVTAFDGDATTYLSDGLITDPAALSYLLSVGASSGNPQVTLERVDMDYTTAAVSGGGGKVGRQDDNHTNVTNAGRLTVLNSRLRNASLNYFNTFGPTTLRRCFIGSPGVNSFPGTAAKNFADRDHIEALHHFGGGEVLIEECCIDASDGLGRIAAGVTALLYAAGWGGKIRLVVRRSLLLGIRAIGGNYPIQVAGWSDHVPPTVIELVLEDNLIEKGSSGYLGKSDFAGSSITATGNRDASTLQNIDALLLN
jgi:hypothetical protein